jgi:prepilin-type processing-associated H-X9-DG protein
LVVIAVIAILASLVLPALSRGKEKGRSIKCVSNLRQVGMGVQMYSQDYSSHLPWVATNHWVAPSNPMGPLNFIDPSAPNFRANAYWELQPYIGKGDGFWQCPSARDDPALTVVDGGGPLISYMSNPFVIGVEGGPFGAVFAPRTVSSMLDPSTAKVFFDLGANWQGIFSMTTYTNTISTASFLRVMPGPLHRGGLNIVRLDGHCTYIAPTEFLQPGGPSVPYQSDPRQNWWRDGAVQLAAGP